MNQEAEPDMIQTDHYPDCAFQQDQGASPCDCGYWASKAKPQQAEAGELREVLAKLAHEQWSGWMDYLFSKCIDYKPDSIQAECGAVILPKWAVDRWRGQAATIYAELSPEEQDSDRTEADKFLAVFRNRIEQLEDELKQLKKDLEQGFMKGAYARLKELQEIEWKYQELCK